MFLPDHKHDNTDPAVRYIKEQSILSLNMLYPRTEAELAISVGSLYLLARNLELIYGPKLIFLTFITSQLFTFFTTINSRVNFIRNEEEKNPYALSFTATFLPIFAFSPLRNFRWLHWMSIVIVVGYCISTFFTVRYDYEMRPVYLTGLLISLLLRWKFLKHTS